MLGRGGQGSRWLRRLLGGGAQDVGDGPLGGCAAPGAVAAPYLAVDHGWADGLLAAPVGGLDAGRKRQAVTTDRCRVQGGALANVAPRPRASVVADLLASDALAQAPEHQLADPALVAILVNASEATLLAGEGPQIPGGETFLGRLYKSLVDLSVRVVASTLEATTSRLRTQNGDHEIEPTIDDRDGRTVAIESKLSATVSDRDVRHLNWLDRHIGDRLVDRLVINTGPAAYRRGDGVAAVATAAGPLQHQLVQHLIPVLCQPVVLACRAGGRLAQHRRHEAGPTSACQKRVDGTLTHHDRLVLGSDLAGDFEGVGLRPAKQPQDAQLEHPALQLRRVIHFRDNPVSDKGL